MPSIMAKSVLRVLDKESMSEKFKKLTLEVVGSRKTICAVSAAHQGTLRHGAGHRTDGSGKTTRLYAAINEIKTDEDKIITIEDRWSINCAASPRFRSMRKRD